MANFEVILSFKENLTPEERSFAEQKISALMEKLDMQVAQDGGNL